MRKETPGLRECSCKGPEGGCFRLFKKQQRGQSDQSRGRKRKEDPQQCGSQRPRWFDFHHEGDESY